MRKLGLVMGDPMVFAEHISVDRVAAGELDMTLPLRSTQMERFFNEHTVGFASKWLLLHQEDERFLPEPNPTRMEMGRQAWEFIGELRGRASTCDGDD